MRVFHGIDELQAALGEHLGFSDWHTVTQEQIDTFADATGDHQWIHVDPQRAASGPFGTTIAHGYLTLSLVPLLVTQVYGVQGVTMLLNYGANKVRFPAPVPSGSRIRGGVELVSLERAALGYQLVTRVTVDLEGSAKPACVAETVVVVVP